MTTPHRWSFVQIRNKKYVLLSFIILKETKEKKRQREVFHGKTYLAQARLMTSKYSSPFEET